MSLQAKCFERWTWGEDDLFDLGAARYATAVTPDGRQISLQPRIEAVLNNDGEQEECTAEEALPVLTVLLQDLHQCFFAYESIRPSSHATEKTMMQ